MVENGVSGDIRRHVSKNTLMTRDDWRAGSIWMFDRILYQPYCNGALPPPVISMASGSATHGSANSADM